MTFDYAALRTKGDDLIAKFGASATLRRKTASGTEWNPTYTTADYSTVVAIVDYNIREIDGVSVLRTDKKALVSAGLLGSVVPTVGDLLIVNSVSYQVVFVSSIAPAGVSVCHECQLRV